MESKLNLTMLTDFYELTMADGYFETGMAEDIAYFDMFFRKVPDGGGFAIMADHRLSQKPEIHRRGHRIPEKQEYVLRGISRVSSELRVQV